MSGNTAIIIPARLGSTRMPCKMLRNDTGYPLICYAVAAAEAARQQSGGTVAEVVVATDDKSIFEAVHSFAATKGYAARAEMTASTHRSGTDRIAEVTARLPQNISRIINIQGDEPDLPAREILRVGELLDRHPDAAMSTLVRPITSRAEFDNPNMVKALLDSRGKCLYFSRSPVPHDRDGALHEGEILGYLHYGIYGYRRDTLLGYADLPESRLENLEKLEQLRALDAGLEIFAAVTDYIGTGIDTEEDYRIFVQRMEGDDG